LKIMNKNWTYLFWIVCLISGFTVKLGGENPSTGYTLNQLVQLAQQNNLLLKITGLDIDIAAAEYRDQRALPNPGFEYAKGKFEIPGEPRNPSIWEMGIKWAMPNPLYRHFLLKSSRTFITEAEIQAEMNKRNIIKDLKTHYYRLQFYKKIKTFWQDKLQRLEEVNKITKAKVSIGESKEIDYLRSSVEIQKNKTYLFRIEKIIDYEKTKVNEFLNYILPEDFTTEEDFSFTPLPEIEKRINQLIETSPLIRLKFNQVKRESTHHKAASFSIIEEIELLGEQEQEFEGKKWKVGIGISIPIFNWKSAQIKKAKLQKQKARIEYEHERKHFSADIQRMIAEIRVLEKEIETFNGAILKEGRENMDLSETLYKEGEVSLVVFLDSQNSFFEIQERYYEAITQWNILKAELLELIGEEI
jgi:outer membrane protein TolC